MVGDEKLVSKKIIFLKKCDELIINGDIRDDEYDGELVYEFIIEVMDIDILNGIEVKVLVVKLDRKKCKEKRVLEK